MDPHDLESSPHHIVGYLRARTDTVLPFALRRDDQQRDVHGRYLLAVDDGNAYLAAGVAGLGVLWLPDYMAAAHVTSGALVRVLSDWQVAPMPLYVAFPPNRHVSAKLRVFIDWVAALLETVAPVQTLRPR